jgi:peptidyl-prolyl cis-trans isomerase B (cyclophilin B)
VSGFTGPAGGPHPRVRIVTTQGNIYVELYPEWAPLTVENFLNLANRGYYDNNRWFRIVPDFVVQTGDPSGNGEGDAGYMIPAEENPIEQDSYVISMGLNYTNPPDAHAIRDSAGTQFYITLSPQLHLDRDFTVFGKVFDGTDVLGRLIESDKIVRVERLPDSKS